MKIKKVDYAVSEIIGTILLLTIVVVVFSKISFFISSFPSDSSNPFVTITGKVEGANIILTHCGGESLSLSSVVFINMDNSTIRSIVGNYLDNISKDDGWWNIGEKLNIPNRLLQNQEVGIIITDEESNSLVFKEVFYKE